MFSQITVWNIKRTSQELRICGACRRSPFCFGPILVIFFFVISGLCSIVRSSGNCRFNRSLPPSPAPCEHRSKTFHFTKEKMGCFFQGPQYCQNTPFSKLHPSIKYPRFRGRRSKFIIPKLWKILFNNTWPIFTDNGTTAIFIQD